MGREASRSAGPAEADVEAGYCLKRITTGNRELDDILGGGFLENSINILMGEPGSGKTILAEELIFANAAAGDGDEQRPILYLTTLSEPLDKVIKYLQQFQFFDAARIGSTIVYESIGIELAKKGVAALLPRLKDAIKTMSPRILVIDSFKAIHDLATSTQEMRLILYEVAGLLTAYDTTVLLVGEYRHEDIDRYPEFAVADGIVELARNALGTRDERYLRVLKLRGSSYRQGTHAFDITAAGLQVYPRLVSPVAAASYDAALSRVPSGIPGLDPMLAGGLWAGSATLERRYGRSPALPAGDRRDGADASGEAAALRRAGRLERRVGQRSDLPASRQSGRQRRAARPAAICDRGGDRRQQHRGRHRSRQPRRSHSTRGAGVHLRCLPPRATGRPIPTGARARALHRPADRRCAWRLDRRDLLGERRDDLPRSTTPRRCRSRARLQIAGDFAPAVPVLSSCFRC